MKNPREATTSQDLSTTLKWLRKESGLSQEQLGKRLGVNQRRVSLIETSPHRASYGQIARLVSLLGGRLVIEPATGEVQEQAVSIQDTPSVWLL